MSIVMKNLCVGFCLFLLLALLLALPQQSIRAQTGPESTPEGGYPPPATPAEPAAGEGYPSQPLPPTTTPLDSGYVPQATAVPATDAAVQSVIGSEAPAPTAVATSPISQSALVRNRAILWAGFLITLLIFGIAVYGAMLMYTRRRS